VAQQTVQENIILAVLPIVKNVAYGVRELSLEHVSNIRSQSSCSIGRNSGVARAHRSGHSADSDGDNEALPKLGLQKGFKLAKKLAFVDSSLVAM
jgi:hypothetical protein